jgi:hypothetical protein
MLDAQYDDKYTRFGGGAPTFTNSADLSPVDRNELWREVTANDREPDWGADPRFVIATEYGGRWRKMMIVDSASFTVTFRSSTTSSTYRPVLQIGGTNWRMDNAMQDASTEIMRRFLSLLRSLRR